MNYFIACLRGDYERYARTKQSLRMKSSDHMWVVGDAISGSDPEGSIDILEDIAASSNTSLVLGDSEYMQIMRLMSDDDPEGEEEWAAEALKVDPDANAFTEAMRDLPQSRYKFLLEEFLMGCELTASIKIGDRWVYICHGAPQPHFGPTSVAEWQYAVVANKVYPGRSYWSMLKTDPEFAQALAAQPPATPEKTILVTAGCSPEEAAQDAGVQPSPSGVYYRNGVFVIGGSEAPVLGIDAAGFVVKRGFQDEENR